jgi:hypothetical protein
MIRYNAREYNGWVAADPPIIEALFPLVEGLVGRPITEVADVEINANSAETLENASAPQHNPDETQPPESAGNEVSLRQQLTNDTAGRELWLQSLLASIQLAGTANYQPEIVEILTMQSLTEKERDIIKDIFIAGFEQALKEDRDATAWTYQCLAQRLILRQPFDDVAFPADAGYGNIHRADDAVAVTRTTPPPLIRTHHDVVLKSKQNRLIKLTAVTGVFCLMLVASFFLGHTLHQRGLWNEQPKIAHLQSPSTEDPSPIDGAGKNLPETAAERGPSASSSPVSGDQEKVSRRSLPAATKTKRLIEDPTRKFSPFYKVRHNIPLRARPEFSSPAVDTVIRGAKVKVLGSRGDWLNIQTTSERRSGFIRKEFVVPIAKTDLS